MTWYPGRRLDALHEAHTGCGGVEDNDIIGVDNCNGRGAELVSRCKLSNRNARFRRPRRRAGKTSCARKPPEQIS